MIASLRARDSHNLFAKRVVFLENENIKNSELKYILKINKDNKNDNDLFLIIDEKKIEKKKDFDILFKNNDNASSLLFKIRDNILS